MVINNNAVGVYIYITNNYANYSGWGGFLELNLGSISHLPLEPVLGVICKDCWGRNAVVLKCNIDITTSTIQMFL